MVEAINRIERECNGHVRPMIGLPAMSKDVTNPMLIRQIHDTISWARQADRKGCYHLINSSENYLDSTLYDYNVRVDNVKEMDIPLLLPVNTPGLDKDVMTSTCGMCLLKDNLKAGSVELEGIIDKLLTTPAIECTHAINSGSERNVCSGSGGSGDSGFFTGEGGAGYTAGGGSGGCGSGEVRGVGSAGTGGGGGGTGKKDEKVIEKIRLVVGGSSHASRIANHLATKGIKVRDLTARGWSLSKENV